MTSEAATPAHWLSAGRVGRPHGLDGSFYVLEPRPLLLDGGMTVRVGAEGPEREIVRRAGTDARPIVRLAGCEHRDGAEAMRGTELFAPRTAAPALDDDEFWAEDLVGCRVHDGARDLELGVVRRLVGLPSCEVLEVERAGGGADLLVPMVRDAIRSVDPEARLVDVDAAFLGEDAARSGEDGG